MCPRHANDVTESNISFNEFHVHAFVQRGRSVLPQVPPNDLIIIINDIDYHLHDVFSHLNLPAPST